MALKTSCLSVNPEYCKLIQLNCNHFFTSFIINICEWVGIYHIMRDSQFLCTVCVLWLVKREECVWIWVHYDLLFVCLCVCVCTMQNTSSPWLHQSTPVSSADSMGILSHVPGRPASADPHRPIKISSHPSPPLSKTVRELHKEWACTHLCLSLSVINTRG